MPIRTSTSISMSSRSSLSMLLPLLSLVDDLNPASIFRIALRDIVTPGDVCKAAAKIEAGLPQLIATRVV